METPPLREGPDYYVDPDGRYVFTASYLLARGYCCRNGCRHCPYGFVREDDADDRSAAQVANGDGPPEGSPGVP